MNCLACGVPLERWQHAQAVQVLGEWVRPGSVCDDCARAGGWQPGSPAAQERLLRGEVDPVEQARLADELPSVSAPIGDVLRRAARAGGFEIPEPKR